MSSTNRRLAVKEYCEVEGKKGYFIQYDTILHLSILHCTTLHHTPKKCHLVCRLLLEVTIETQH